MWFLNYFIITSLVCGVFTQDFEVPEATVEAFKPRGLRVSIPHIPGIRLFAFHGNINQEVNGREAGDISRDVTRQKDGRWTLWDPSIRLEVGDVLYFWTYVEYNDGKRTLGYPYDDQQFTITELKPIGHLQKKPGRPNRTTPTTTRTTRTTRTTPTTPTILTVEPRRPTIPPKPSCDLNTLTTVNNQPACKNMILFEENFSNFDKNKWKTEVKIASKPDYEFCIYVNFPENVAVKNGNLFLKPTLSTDRFGEDFLSSQINLGRNCTGVPGTVDCSKTAESFLILPPVLSGKITTRDKFSFKYGKVEIRAKVPKGNWIYPIIALQPAHSEYGLHYDSGEIVIACVPGNENLGKDLSAGVILSSSEDGRTYGIRHNLGEEHWGNAFHTYTVKWTPEYISLSVDGNEYDRITPPEGGFASEAGNLQSIAGEGWLGGSPMAPFDKEMYLSLGVGVGGHSFSDITPGGKPWRNSDPKNILKFWQSKDKWFQTWNENSAMRVDYVKITSL